MSAIQDMIGKLDWTKSLTVDTLDFVPRRSMTSVCFRCTYVTINLISVGR